MKYWYYQESEQQKGPIAENDFRSLIDSGSISPSTFVWTEGLKGWQTAGTIENSVPSLFSPSSAPAHCAVAPPPFCVPPAFSPPPASVVDDKREARRFQIHMEELAKDTHDWISRAESWKRLGDEPEMRRCMQKAEELVNGASAWSDCAFAWKGFGDEREARRCLLKAEECDQTSGAWRTGAESWKRMGDEREMQRCMRKAEELANGSSAWSRCASVWKGLGAEHEAQRCLEKAEALAKESSEWSDCATVWKAWGNESEAKRCVEKAIEFASRGQDATTLCWIVLGYKCSHDPVGEQRARECVQKAEKLAKYPEDWISCANFWTEPLHDDREAQRCRKKSTELNVRLRYWTSLKWF